MGAKFRTASLGLRSRFVRACKLHNKLYTSEFEVQSLGCRILGFCPQGIVLLVQCVLFTGLEAKKRKNPLEGLGLRC